MHPDPFHQVNCSPDSPPPSRTTPPVRLPKPPSTSEAPKATGYPSEHEAISAFISKLRECAIALTNLPESFYSALAALTKTPLHMTRDELRAMLSAPANTSPPSQMPSSSTGSPALAASSPLNQAPSFTPTAGGSPSTGVVPPAKLLDSRLAVEYFRLEAHCEDMPPIIGSGDITMLMTKLVGLVKIGYSFKFYPQRCRCQFAGEEPVEGIILRKNENGTYQAQLDDGRRPQLKPWEVVEIA